MELFLDPFTRFVQRLLVAWTAFGSSVLISCLDLDVGKLSQNFQSRRRTQLPSRRMMKSKMSPRKLQTQQTHD